MTTNPVPSSENKPSAASGAKAAWAYPAAVRTAAVAGVFCAVVAGMLLVDYFRRGAEDPHENAAYQEAKAELASLTAGEPTAEAESEIDALRVSIRAMDLQFRREYFAHREFTRIGALLLLAGAVVLLVAWRVAAAVRPRLPDPGPHTTAQDVETQWTRWARGGVAGVALLLVATAIGLLASIRAELPDPETEVSALLGSEEEAPEGGALADATPVDCPAPEELARNWASFRGPGGAGISAYDNLPAEWDDASGKNILWKTPVPLPGNNSPLVWEGNIFLAGADETQRQVYCFDAAKGELLWTADAPGTAQSTLKPPEVSGDTGYAAPTAVTDGRRVYAMFANGDVVAVDFDGQLVWEQSLGIPQNVYGHAASLAMHQNLVLVQFDQAGRKDGKSRMIALNAATGKTAWKVPRAVPNSWASPIVAEAAGRWQLITAAAPWLIAYNPADGSELWRAKCLEADVGPSPVVRDDVVYVANEFPELTAIRADGSGDVTESHVLWTGEDGLPDTCSPLASEKYLFLLASYGMLSCYDRAEGEWLWEMEFDCQFTASPSLVGDRVYLFGEVEKPEEEMTEAEKESDDPVMITRAWVIEPGDGEGKIVGEGRLEEGCVTSPALRDGRFFIRGKKHLFAIGQP